MHSRLNPVAVALVALCLAWAGTARAAVMEPEREIRPAPAAPPPATAPAARPAPGQGRLVALDFDNADIRVVIRLVSELTGRNFLVDDRVKGRVTIMSPKRIPLGDVYRVFLSILEVNGLSAVRVGDVTKIVPAREVRQKGIETRVSNDGLVTHPEDRMVTQLIDLKYADANVVKALIAPLVSRDGMITSYAPTNTLIVTDELPNIDRLLKIVRGIDVEAGGLDLAVLPLKYASAEDVAQIISTAFAGGGPASPQPAAAVRARVPAPRIPRPTIAPAGAQSVLRTLKIIPDPRTNSLIVLSSADNIARVKSLVEKLDVKTPVVRGQVHVYYLQYAQAEDLAKVLTAQPIVEGKSGKGAKTGGQPAPPPPSAGPQKITITPDKATNSLVITASPEDYADLKQVIEKLDIPRSQVLVEALIAETTLNKALQLGVEWRSMNQPTGGAITGFGGTNLPTPGDSQGALNEAAAGGLFGGPTGLVIGAAKGTIQFGSQTFVNLGALIRALKTDSDVKILSTPELLTSDNQEAQIIVGENRPFLQSAQTTDLGAVVRTYQFKDVGITLRFTPQISQGKFVRLKLFTEVKSFVSEVETGAPVTTERQAETNVIVRDGDTVVIGGLISNNDNEGASKVPILGDLPLIGALFRSSQKSEQKSNLLIFITPRIVNTAEELKRLSEEKKSQAEEINRKFQEEQGRGRAIGEVLKELAK